MEWKASDTKTARTKDGQRVRGEAKVVGCYKGERGRIDSSHEQRSLGSSFTSADRSRRVPLSPSSLLE